MKVFLVSNHNPHFVNTVELRERAIKSIGHKIIFQEDREFVIPGRIRQRIAILQKWDQKRLNKKIVSHCLKKKPDVCLIVGGYYILPKTIAAIKDLGIPVILWTSDAPIDFVSIERTANLYNNVFCAGTEAIEILNNICSDPAEWLPFGCDPEYHKPINLLDEEKRRYSSDVAFVGSFYVNRWNIIKELKEFDIKVFGPGWAKARANSCDKLEIHDRPLNYDEWVKIYNSAKIVLIIHFQDGKTPCYQASPKVFEALACKRFVLTDKQKDAINLFEERKHLVSYNNVSDLKNKIHYYIENTDERTKIAENGYKEVLRRHTWIHRAQKIFSNLPGTHK